MEFFSKISMAFSSGGMWMWVILGLQLATIVIIIDRCIALFMKRKTDQMEIAESFEKDIRTGNINDVYERARSMEETSPVARTVAAGSMAAMNLGGRDEIQSKMDEVLLKENQVLEKRTGFLAMLGNVATLTGLLGTITGMIKSFAAVSFASPTEKATLLSNGISEAMSTTAYGLIVAIPALLMFAVISNRSNQLAEDLNQSALKAFNWLSYSYNPLSLRPSRVAANSRPVNQPEADA